MRPAQEPIDPTQHPRTRRALLPYVNLTLAFALTIGLAGVTTRLADGAGGTHQLQAELSATKTEIQRLEADNARRLESVIVLNQSQREGHQRDLERNRDAWSARVEGLKMRLHELEVRASKESAATAASIREELDSLRQDLREELRPKNDAEDVFRQFEETHREGVVLIYTEFDYHYVKQGVRRRKKTVTGWGTGFFVTTEGHIVTNKHVVNPWKFDADLMAMEAMGDIAISRDSLRLFCWQSGDRVLGADGEPSGAFGLNSHEKKNLEIFAVACDVMHNETVEFGPDVTRYCVHDLNNNDLAILKAKGGPFRPLPIAKGGDAVTKLDPIMAIGFPRGKRGLERDAAESSPSIGTVRKVENTIHITASIIPGNSGGPLVGPHGEVVGVVTRIYSETLGICIRVEHAMNLLREGIAKSKPEPKAKAKPVSSSGGH